jgi:MHS family shikimate/dehydroshikimate transporter-like MFS transporter
MFSPEVRYSGASLGYQVGAILGGGFAPLILTSLLATGLGAATVLPPYLIVVSILTFIAVFFATRTGRKWVATPTESKTHV